MKIEVLNIQGKKTGKEVELPADIFGIEVNEHAIYLDVKRYLANQRQGTHKAKERGEIKGSTRKLRKQKGAGAARVGSIKNPLFRGGGRVFGPRPRNYSFKLNKKVRALARRSALTQKATDNQVMLVESFNFDAPKTKDFFNVLKSLNISSSKCLFVLPEANETVLFSSNNIPTVKVKMASDLHTYDIMNTKHIVFLEGSIEKLENTFSAN